MNPQKTKYFINQFWRTSIMPAFKQYIRIPCKSPAFDHNWEKHGYLMQAAKLMAKWAEAQKIPGLKSKIFKTQGKSPVLYLEIPGHHKETTLLYCHLDKMPEIGHWSKGLHPWKAVIKNNRLYGRGTADDGYAFFAHIAAIKNLVEQKIPYNRCVLLVEAAEESSSCDLPHYLKKLRSVMGKVSLIICSDVGLHDDKRLWVTNALRGTIKATLSVKVLKGAAHSGTASGIIPSSFRVLRQLLDRIEDPMTGKSLLKSCHVTIPQEHKRAAQKLARLLGKTIYTVLPITTTIKPVTNNLSELLLNRTWRSTLCVTGIAGIPDLQNASNALRPETSAYLSIRTPPTVKPEKVVRELQKILTDNPPYNATITFTPHFHAAGWAATHIAPWLTQVLNHVSLSYFGKPMLQIAEGGNVGVIPLLNEMFPQAQIIPTGAMDMQSHEHAPDESLHLPTAHKITCCLSEILAAKYQHMKK